MGFRSPSIYSQAGYRAAIRASIGLRTMPAIFSKNCSAGVEIRIRSEDHTSELQSLMRISYAVFCLTKKNTPITLATFTCNVTTDSTCQMVQTDTGHAHAIPQIEL